MLQATIYDEVDPASHQLVAAPVLPEAHKGPVVAAHVLPHTADVAGLEGVLGRDLDGAAHRGDVLVEGGCDFGVGAEAAFEQEDGGHGDGVGDVAGFVGHYCG